MFKKTSSRKVSVTLEELQEKIRERAYELFLKRGCELGHDLEDWLTAEAQVKKELGIR